MKTILTTLSKASFLETACLAALEIAFVPFTYVRDEHLLRPGEVQDRIFFLEKGVVMCHRHKDAHHLVNWFAEPNDFAASVESFHYQRPSLEYLTACTPVEGAYLTKKEYEKLLERFSSLNILHRRILIHYLIQGQRRVDNMLLLDTCERYCAFMVERPSLFKQLPNKLIAAYLGTTESTFSKMRRKFQENEKGYSSDIQ